MSKANPAIEYIVIRPAEGIVDNPGAASHFEGQWHKRADLVEQEFVEFDGANGTIRAYPTDRVERSAGDDHGQVYEVVNGTRT